MRSGGVVVASPELLTCHASVSVRATQDPPPACLSLSEQAHEEFPLPAHAGPDDVPDDPEPIGMVVRWTFQEEKGVCGLRGRFFFSGVWFVLFLMGDAPCWSSKRADGVRGGTGVGGGGDAETNDD